MKYRYAVLCRAFVLFCCCLFAGRAAAVTLTLGTGTLKSGEYPLNTCWQYNYSQSLYISSDLVSAGAVSGTPGYIYSIQYYQSTAVAVAGWKDWRIYMGNTSTSSFSGTSAWLPVSAMTNVFSGTVSPSGTGWYTITLSTPFYWDGFSNIVVAVDENSSGFACTAQWQNTATGSDYRSIVYYSDDINPDPASPPAAVTRGLQYPNMKFEFSPAAPCTGAPAAGTAIATAAAVCPGTAVSIAVSGAASATGLTMQWESAVAAGGPWSVIPGATDAVLNITPAACSDHYYRRVLTCTASGIAVPSAAAAVSVSCPVTPPYLETFESIATANQWPSCMTATNSGLTTFSYLSAPGTYNRSNHTAGGSKFAAFSYGADDYLFTAPVQLTAGKTYEFSFWYVTDGIAGWKTLEARVGNAAAAVAMTTSLGVLRSVNNVLYQQFKVVYSPAATGTFYFGIYCSSGTGPWYLSVDDIGVRELPPCTAAPVAGTATASPVRVCSSGAPTLSLSGTSEVTGLRYRWESSMTGAPGTYGALAGGTTPVFTAPSISSGTYYRAVVTCTLTGDSGISTPVYVAAGAYDPPYREGFEGITAPNQIPACMTATSVAPYVYTYMLPTGSYRQSNHTPGGYRFASFRYGANDWIITPAINVVAGRTYEFSFWYVTDGLPGWTTLKAAYGTSPAAAAMTVPLGTTLTALTNTSYQQFRARFVATATGPVHAGIYCNANTNPWYLTVDDLQLQELPACDGSPVTGLPAASPDRICGSGSTTLDLPALASVGHSYKWQDSVAGGSWGTGPGRPSFGGFSVPFVTGSCSVTTYFRCIVTCTATGDSSISPVLPVTAGPAPMPYFQDFERITVANQLPECMSATSIAPSIYTYLSAPGSYNRSNHTPGGSKFAAFREASDDYLFTAPIALQVGYRYAFSFWYITDGASGWNTLRGTIGNAPTAGAMSLPLRTVTSPVNTSYRQYTDTFSVSSSGTYYGAVYCKGTTGPWYLSVDDISIQPLPCTDAPAAGTISGSAPSGIPLCAGTRITLRNRGATPKFVPGISYQWQSSPAGLSLWSDIGGATDTILTAASLVGMDIRFRVRCTGSGLSSYSAIYSLPALPPHPPVSIEGGAPWKDFCLGDTLWLNATAYTDAVYTWMLDGKPIPGWTGNNFGTPEAGVYSVMVRSPLADCPAVSDVITLSGIDPGFWIYMDGPADTVICTGDSIVLHGYSVPGVDYQWRRNNIDIAGETGTSYVVRSSGSYRVTANHDSAVCKAVSRNVVITVSSLPDALIIPENPSYTACEEPGLLLKTGSSSTYLYQWSRNGTPVFGAVDSFLRVKMPGIYTVKIRNAANCVTVSDEAPVKILPVPVPVISRRGMVLYAGKGYASYEWYRNGVRLSGADQDTLALTHNGLYTVTVRDENSCKGSSAPLEVLHPELSIPDSEAAASGIRIYPNPTSGLVQVVAPVPVRVSVRDITGRTVLSAGGDQVDISRLADGLYLFVVSDKEGMPLGAYSVSKQAGR